MTFRDYKEILSKSRISQFPLSKLVHWCEWVTDHIVSELKAGLALSFYPYIYHVLNCNIMTSKYTFFSFHFVIVHKSVLVISKLLMWLKNKDI